MSVGFGFSVGDFLAAIELVTTIVDALRQNGQANNEIRELLRQLYGLEAALIRVKHLELEDVQQAESLALHQAAAQCQQTITDFYDKIQPFQKNLGPSAPTSARLKKGWMRIRWALCKKEDVARFKADLAGHTASIQLLLSTLHLARANTHRRQQDSQQRSLASIVQDGYFQLMQKLSTMSNHLTSSLQVGSQLLQMTAQVVRTNIQVFQIVLSLQNTITQVARQQPVYLIDGLGRASPFYLEFIRSKEALVAVLAVNFQKFGSDRRILNGEFAIEDSTTKKEIDLDADWDLVFSPGQQVEMSMFVRQALRSASYCPKCKTSCGSEHGRDVECPSCGFVFRCTLEVEELPRIATYRDAPQLPKSGYSSLLCLGNSLPPGFRHEVEANDEIRLFRKIRMVSTTYSTPNAEFKGGFPCALFRFAGSQWVHEGPGFCAMFVSRGINRDFCFRVFDERDSSKILADGSGQHIHRLFSQEAIFLSWVDRKSVTRAVQFEPTADLTRALHRVGFIPIRDLVRDSTILDG